MIEFSNIKKSSYNLYFVFMILVNIVVVNI